jgi:hypothetical protein
MYFFLGAIANCSEDTLIYPFFLLKGSYRTVELPGNVLASLPHP